MNPEQLKQVWQTQSLQSRLTIDAELLMQELRRNQRHFNTSIVWRDVREVSIGLLMVPLWFYLGFKLHLPWTWYLVVPVLVWVVGFMLFDLSRHKRKPSETGESLLQCAESSLAEVEHQIWLLRNVLWWSLLPMAVPVNAFLLHVLWLAGSRDWLTVEIGAGMIAFELIIFGGVYKVNQDCVRDNLEPRRRELQALLAGLSQEAPAASETPTDEIT